MVSSRNIPLFNISVFFAYIYIYIIIKLDTGRILCYDRHLNLTPDTSIPFFAEAPPVYLPVQLK
jgi:hypothetical protein